MPEFTSTGAEYVDEFFAHYGRKGMKRGMNIFNPNYNPIGKKAKRLYTIGKFVSKAASAKQTAENLYDKGTKAYDLVQAKKTTAQGVLNDIKNAQYQKEYDKEQAERERKYAAEQTAANKRMAEAAAIESSANKGNVVSINGAIDDKNTKLEAERRAMGKAASAATVLGNLSNLSAELARKENLLNAEKARMMEKGKALVEDAKKKAVEASTRLPIDADTIVEIAKPVIDTIGANPDSVKESVNTLLDGIKGELTKIKEGNNSEVLNDIEYVYKQVEEKVDAFLSKIKKAIAIGGETLDKIRNTEYGQAIEKDIDKRVKRLVRFAISGEYSYDEMKQIAEANLEKLKETIQTQKKKAFRKSIDKVVENIKSPVRIDPENSLAFKIIKSVVHSDEGGTDFGDTSRVDNFFAHYGIQGQKWGVRRYQNPDGSLTDAGRKRYFYSPGQKIRPNAAKVIGLAMLGIPAKSRTAWQAELTKKGAKALTNRETGELSEAGKALVSSLIERSKVAHSPSYIAKGQKLYRATTKDDKINTTRKYVSSNNEDRKQYVKWAINNSLGGDYNTKGLVVNEYKTKGKVHVAPMMESINTAMSKLKDTQLTEARKQALVNAGVFTKKFVNDMNIGKLYVSGGADAFSSAVQKDKKTSTEGQWLDRRNKALRQTLGMSLDKVHKLDTEENKKVNKEFKEEMKKKGYDAVVDTYDVTLNQVTGIPYILLNPKNSIQLEKQNVVWEPSKKSVAHSGILGMKWGLRRFQNPDGTLTEAGRKRYAKKGTAKLISDKEKYRAQKAKWARDPAMLYKHKDEYTKAELDKAMEVFASQNRIKAQLEADKAAKQKAKEDLKKSKIEYKKLQLQDKMNQAKAEEDYKQLKLKTEQAKLLNKQNEEAAKQKQQFANKDAQIALWKKRAEKAKNIMDYAKAGKTILDDMGITSKEEGESLLGSIAVGLGIKDISAAQAKKEAKEKQEKVEGAIGFMNKIAGMYKSLNEGNKSNKFEIKFDNDKTENITLDDILKYFETNKFVS